MFLVCVLGYGDDVALMTRCLGSIAATLDPALICEVRVGLNAPTDGLRRYVGTVLAALGLPAAVFVPAGGHNAGKYPLMRRMFSWSRSQTSAGMVPDRVMWFDDDSYIRPQSTRQWWAQVDEVSRGVQVVGSHYSIGARGNQRIAVPHQPWYRGRPVGPAFQFVTGGWWVADRWFLEQHDYPFPALYHCGGDVMLGELCRQQRAIVRHFREGVAINADMAGNESQGPHRGLSVAERHTPVWAKFDPSAPCDLSHHQFAVEVATY